jgi:hypothetical protein
LIPTGNISKFSAWKIVGGGNTEDKHWKRTLACFWGCQLAMNKEYVPCRPASRCLLKNFRVQTYTWTVQTLDSFWESWNCLYTCLVLLLIIYKSSVASFSLVGHKPVIVLTSLADSCGKYAKPPVWQDWLWEPAPTSGKRKTLWNEI